MDLSINELITLAGFIGAGVWFYWTQKFKPRMEFDIDCGFFLPDAKSDDLIAEIRLILNNKGMVQHTIRRLELSVHGLSDNRRIETRPNTNDVMFEATILARQPAVPNEWTFWVRPNVRQPITKLISVNKRYPVIRVTASFAYGGLVKSRHTARRVFEVPAIARQADSD